MSSGTNYKAIQNYIDVAAEFIVHDIGKNGPVGHPWPHWRHSQAASFALETCLDADRMKRWLESS